MPDIDPEEAREHFDAIAERLTTMLGLLQAQFKVSPDLIASVAGAVIVENGGRSALDALALGSEAGLLRFEAGRQERRKRAIEHSTPFQFGGNSK